MEQSNVLTLEQIEKLDKYLAENNGPQPNMLIMNPYCHKIYSIVKKWCHIRKYRKNRNI